MPALGRAYARPDVITDPLPLRVGLDAGEEVEACLEPGGDALGDLERLVEGALGAKGVVEGAAACLLRRDCCGVPPWLAREPGCPSHRPGSRSCSDLPPARAVRALRTGRGARELPVAPSCRESTPPYRRLRGPQTRDSDSVWSAPLRRTYMVPVQMFSFPGSRRAAGRTGARVG